MQTLQQPTAGGKSLPHYVHLAGSSLINHSIQTLPPENGFLPLGLADVGFDE